MNIKALGTPFAFAYWANAVSLCLQLYSGLAVSMGLSSAHCRSVVFFRWFAANILFLTEMECESMKMFNSTPWNADNTQFAYSCEIRLFFFYSFNVNVPCATNRISIPFHLKANGILLK